MSGPRMHTLAAMLVEKLKRHRPSGIAIGFTLKDGSHVAVRLSPEETEKRNAASLARARAKGDAAMKEAMREGEAKRRARTEKRRRARKTGGAT